MNVAEWQAFRDLAGVPELKRLVSYFDKVLHVATYVAFHFISYLLPLSGHLEVLRFDILISAWS